MSSVFALILRNCFIQHYHSDVITISSPIIMTSVVCVRFTVHLEEIFWIIVVNQGHDYFHFSPSNIFLRKTLF